jgi:uncharacterized protein (UPF0335 family)
MTKTNFAKDQLKSLDERVERLEVEKRALTDDIKEIYVEAKGNGFDAKIIRQVVRIRKMDPVQRQTDQELTDLYLSAVNGSYPE